MAVNKVYTFDEVARVFVAKAVNYAANRYRAYGVEAGDLASEVNVWLYGDGREKVNRWLGRSPQQTTRIYRSMLDRVIAFGETEKAAVLGYSTEDVQWYDPGLVEALLPLALDTTFTGDVALEQTGAKSGKPPSEGGNLLAMVLDIRRALKGTGLTLYFLDHESYDEYYDDRVMDIVDHLGGERPRVGRRRVMSNATAIAITHEQNYGSVVA